MSSAMIRAFLPAQRRLLGVCSSHRGAFAQSSAAFAPRSLHTATASSGSGDQNISIIREEFKKQASMYAPHPKAIEFVMSEVGAVSGTALDVASGTGVFARALAPLCQRVVSFDATPEMQARARKEAEDAGLSNIEFQLGDGSQLPFEDGSFDVVVSRLAVHHFTNPGAIVNEMARVCKPGGRVIVADIVGDDDPELCAETNRLEILRDPSHTACLTVKGLHDLLEATGRLQVTPHSGNIYMHPLGLHFWMKNTQTPPAVAEEIEERLREELEGGKETGFKPFVAEDGTLTFLHRYVVAQGVRA